jgi:hypothetical protein
MSPEEKEAAKAAKEAEKAAKEAEKEAAKAAKKLLLTVGEEKTVYSKEVHGEDYKEIAENTRARFNGTLTEIE